MRSPIPVALFFSSFEPGGTERQMIELARRLDRRRFSLHVACFQAGGAWLPGIEGAVASIAEFPVRTVVGPSTVATARRFAQWCHDHEIAIVHTADLRANIFGLPAAAYAGVPVRIANRRELRRAGAAQMALQRAACSCAHVVVANSRAAAARLADEHIPAARVRVVNSGIDVSRYRGVPHDRPLRRIATIANLRREKGHDVLLEAVPMVLGRCPDAEFLLAGDGPLRAELEALARGRGIARHVKFLGHADDVPALLAASDVFVLPSRTEAFPSAVLEAMAAGLPVVATAVGGVVELLDHQRTGILVRPDDARALGFALLDLMQWRGHAAALGRAARRVVEQQYSFDRMVDAFERVYLDELRARAPFGVAAEMIAS